MTEHEFDWHAYVLNEMPAAERERAAAYLAAHPEARAEVDELELTLPRWAGSRRPNRCGGSRSCRTRCWSRTGGSGSGLRVRRLAFAGAAMLSLAIWCTRLSPRPAAPAGAPGDDGEHGRKWRLRCRRRAPENRSGSSR
jgi:hypothetical protein